MTRRRARGALRAALALSALLLGACRPAAPGGRRADDFGLLDADGRWHELYRQRSSQATVLVAFGDGCPMSARLAPELNRLERLYAPRGVRFFLLDPHPNDERATLRRFAREYGLAMPILIDDAGLVAGSLGMTRTTEAVLIQRDGWRVVYQGAVDDRLDYHGAKPAAGRRWLEKALKAALAGRAVAEPRTEAKGCLLPQPRGPAPSYRGVIAPIVLQKCADCHSPAGGALPTDLYTRDGLRARAATVRETVLTGRMPPLSYDPAYGVPPEALTLEEKRALTRWIDAGAPLEPGPDTPPPPRLLKARPWGLENFKPDLVWESSVEHAVASTETSVLRYVPLGGPARQDIWIDAVAYRHSAPTVVQHAALYALPRPLEAYDIDPLGDGASFDLAPGLQASIIGTTTGRARSFGKAPPGTAWVIPKGRYPVLELHYNSRGRPERNRTAIGLGLSKATGLRPLKTAFLVRTDFTIPPRAADYVLKAARRFGRDLRVLGFLPHMHLRAKSARLLARLPDGRERVLFSIPNYPSRMRIPAYWSSPQALRAGTVLIAEMTYDNSSDNPLNPDPSAALRWGRGLSENEMLRASVFYEDGSQL